MAGTLLKPNDEHELKTAEEFSALYSDQPVWVARTLEIANRCRFSLSEIDYRYPEEGVPGQFTTAQWLRKLTWEGAHKRYGHPVPEKVRLQVEKELQLIEELQYSGYFLTMWDLVQICQEKRILCQGRGSAANSAVCFCLGITAVDPVNMDLLFERFLSRERAEPPDIDLDIGHHRREEVIQHMYEKYGRLPWPLSPQRSGKSLRHFRGGLRPHIQTDVSPRSRT
jgi:error-prone DNA polymerase